MSFLRHFTNSSLRCADFGLYLVSWLVIIRIKMIIYYICAPCCHVAVSLERLNWTNRIVTFIVSELIYFQPKNSKRYSLEFLSGS